MSLYAIVLNEPDEAAWEKIREAWPAYHIFDNRLAFISADDALTADVSRDTGIGSESAKGIVIQMDCFSGHTAGPLVEWTSKHRD